MLHSTPTLLLPLQNQGLALQFDLLTLQRQLLPNPLLLQLLAHLPQLGLARQTFAFQGRALPIDGLFARCGTGHFLGRRFPGRFRDLYRWRFRCCLRHFALRARKTCDLALGIGLDGYQDSGFAIRDDAAFLVHIDPETA